MAEKFSLERRQKKLPLFYVNLCLFTWLAGKSFYQLPFAPIQARRSRVASCLTRIKFKVAACEVVTENAAYEAVTDLK